MTSPRAAVNTFIGTKDDGNTFPGASMPFGKAQSSPIGSHYAGWRYDDPVIRGFGHFFLSGAGCWEQGGLVSILPVVDVPRSFDHKVYGARYTHDGEVGKPGYYRVTLAGGITAECTATLRCGVERFTFPDGVAGTVMVNVGQANDKEPVFASAVRVVDDHTITGTITAQAFCGGKPYVTHFATTFDRPFKSSGTWGGPSGASGLRGAWATFTPGPVTAATSLSQVDLNGATKNLAEAKDKPFDALRELAEEAWDHELSSIDIQGASTVDRTVFYTALYHVLLQPLTATDIDGRYRGFDGQIHTATNWTYYEYFSLWDTYRGHNQLLALLRPDRARDIARSLLAVHEQGGWLPRWAYANQETNTMTGDPVTPFLVDLWRFGALEGLENQAYNAMWQNATSIPTPTSPFNGRAGNPNYLKHGFVQQDKNFPRKGQDVDPHHGASATLEYALADAALSAMAEALGHTADAAVLRERGLNYKKLWDKDITDRGFQGFPRPKTAEGTWLPTSTPQSDAGFHEGTAWQYQWLVQQDAPGLTTLLGGPTAATARLDDFFAYQDLITDPEGTARNKWVVGAYEYYNQFRYNPNNEPDLHAPWMYVLMGQPWKTSAVITAAHTLFTDSPAGVTGNDDLGQMSAWYVLSALGIYPTTPGTGQFLLHAPRYERAVLHLNTGDLTIEAKNATPTTIQYVQSLTINKTPTNQAYTTLEILRNNTTLQFTLTTEPQQATWATTNNSTPPPLVH